MKRHQTDKSKLPQVDLFAARRNNICTIERVIHPELRNPNDFTTQKAALAKRQM